MKIHLLGTASAAGGVFRDNTSFLINHDQEKIFVDVTGNPLGKLKQLQLSPNSITKVILTHFHLDHYYGLPSLLWGMSLAERKEALEIYCSQAHVYKLNALLEAIEVHTWGHPVPITVHTFDWEQKNKIVDGEDFSIFTFPAIHGTPNVGLQLVADGKTVVYSSDTAKNPIIKELDKVDILIHEATTAQTELPYHTSLEEIIDFYPIQAIGQVILVHLSDDEPYDQFIANTGLKENNIIIAHDGMVIDVV